MITTATLKNQCSPPISYHHKLPFVKLHHRRFLSVQLHHHNLRSSKLHNLASVPLRHHNLLSAKLHNLPSVPLRHLVVVGDLLERGKLQFLDYLRLRSLLGEGSCQCWNRLYGGRSG